MASILLMSSGGVMGHKFTKNSKYYTIGIYFLVFILFATIIVRLIWNWEATSSYLDMLLDVIYPFLVGLLIAYLINPLTKIISDKFLKKIFKEKAKGARKLLSVLLSYIIVIGAIVMVMFYIVPQIGESLTQLVSFIESAQNGYTNIMNKLEELNNSYPQWKFDVIIDAVEKMPDALANVITETLPTLIPTIYNTSLSVISVVVNLLIAVMVSVYMLLDKARLINNCKRILYVILKPERADRFLSTAQECNKIFGNFIIGKMIDSIIIGILCWIIMTIIGLPYALVISVIVGVTNMIPYFGPFIGAIPGILILLIADLPYAIIFAILIIALQQFDGLYLGPKILGESTGLRPIWIIFAITVGGSVAGVAGMFLGVPVVAVIAHLLDRGLTRRINKKELQFDVDPETGIMKRHMETEDKAESQVEESIETKVDNVEGVNNIAKTE